MNLNLNMCTVTLFSINNGIIRKKVVSNKFKPINNKCNFEQGIDDFMKN